MIEEYLVELLLSVVLMFNIGAYSFLWYKIRRIEEKMDSLRNEKERINKSLAELWNRIFGHSDDNTNGGHLAETKNQFKEFEESIADISVQIENISTRREEEHQLVRNQLERLIWMLSSDEDVDIDGDEFDFKS